MIDIYNAWAERNSIPRDTMRELYEMLGVAVTMAVASEASGGSESRQQSLIRIDCARQGMTLFRNNVGALEAEDGRLVRYGLANDNAAINKQIKSGDLIGWRDLTITNSMVGQTVAQFASVECKREDWKWSGDKHELAQLKWIEAVSRAGGYARFANSTFIV